MTTLEDTVRSVVQDFMDRDVLFTALDVSNAVKQQMPHARHREVRDVVRGMFTTDIQTQGWARTPITVTLEDGSTAEALLYHSLTDSWDLDNKYDNQRRSLTSHHSVPASASSVVPVVVSSATPVQVAPVVLAPSHATAPMPTARTLWNQMFQTQPSLFPHK